MSIGEIWRRLRFLFQGDRLEQDLNDELRLHRELRAAKLHQHGLPKEEADYAARRKLGNETRAVEEGRRAWTFAWLEAIFQDLRYAARVLRKSPAFAATAVVTLALGLGLNATLFTIFNAYVLRPFAVRDPYSLYWFSWNTKTGATQGFIWQQFVELRAQNTAYSDALAVWWIPAIVDRRWPLFGTAISGNFFSMLGGDTILGRPIQEDDTRVPGEGAVVVLTYRAWKIRFGGDPGIVGRKVALNGYPFEVIGVASPEFEGIRDPGPMDHYEFWIPLTARGLVKNDGDTRLNIIVRLRPGIARRQAEAALLPYAQQATAHLLQESRAMTVGLHSSATRFGVTFTDLLAGRGAPGAPRSVFAILPIFVAFALVLIICCANVANMMLARGLARQRELGVRLSLGASRARVTRQLLTEGFLIAVLAGLAGIAIARLAIDLILRALTSAYRATASGKLGDIYPVVPLAPLPVDYHVFAFTFVVAALVTLLFALAPAVQVTRPGVTMALRGELAVGVRPSRLRSFLLGSQVAVCLLLLIVAAILVRGADQLRSLDTGLDLRGVFRVEARNPQARVDARKLTLAIAYVAEQQTWAEPPAFAMSVPLAGRGLPRIVAGRGDRDERARIPSNFVSSELFSSLRIPIIRGRNFTREESKNQAAVTIISESAAKRFWPGEEAIGKTILIDQSQKPARSPYPAFPEAAVIGIAGDVAHNILDPDRVIFYFPTHAGGSYAGSVLVRSRVDPIQAAQIEELQARATPVDDLVLADPMERLAEIQLAPIRTASRISSFLGGLSLLLTLSGMYGVISYLVNQRTREIGIRIALGATPMSVLKFVVGQSIRMTVAGLAVGILLAIAASKLLASGFAGINWFDLAAYTAGPLMVMLAGTLAALGPAGRAARLNPADSLRTE
jgi:predicted permease